MKIKYILLTFPAILIIFLIINFIYVSTKSRPEQNQLVIGSIGDASFLNPVLAQDSASSDVNAFVFSGLLKYNEELQLTGDLAESWTVSPGPKPQITFHLRKGVQWHDGHPFTADDVRFTYETIMDEKTNTVRGSDYELVEKVEAIDPYTVRVTYKEPFSPALETWTIGIIPEHLLKGKDINTDPFNRNPIGTGPFVFDLWVSDEKIVLAANPDYFEGKPHLDRIVYRIIPETSLSEIEILTGGIDYTGVFPHQYERIKKNLKLQLYRQASLGYTYIGYNLENPLFQDKRVRQALTCAINREEIVRYVLYGLGQTATGPFPNHLWYADKSIQPFPYDPEKAKRLLYEAGWRDTDGDNLLDKDGKPFSFRLITNSGNDIRRDVGVLVQRYFKEIGLDVELQIYEWSVFLKNFINPKHFDACILGWSLSVDPDAYSIWHSSQIEGGFNFVSYKNPVVDQLWVEGRRTFDIKKRTEIYHKIHRLIHEDQPYTFLYVADSTPALSKKFKRLIVDAVGKETLVPIEMTKGGLLFNIHEWVVPAIANGSMK
ncbi:MAG: peptide-binding protein [Deltaproteobacteria bacterium]|nr:peptide-binding protein [Deltaproteobacteria bacterium]